MDIPNSTREKVEALRARFVGTQGGGGVVGGAGSAQAQALGIERAQVAPAPQGVNPYGLSTTKGRAYDMLSKGMGTLAVARVLDVDPSLVSQYLGEEEFRKGVGAALQARALARTARDEKIDALEDKAWSRLEEVLPFMVKPMEILRVAQVLNSANRRGVQEVGGGSGVVGEGVVTLTLPANVVEASVTLKMNTDNEVVEVNGRELRTMSASSLVDVVGKRKQERLERSMALTGPTPAEEEEVGGQEDEYQEES